MFKTICLRYFLCNFKYFQCSFFNFMYFFITTFVPQYCDKNLKISRDLELRLLVDFAPNFSRVNYESMFHVRNMYVIYIICVWFREEFTEFYQVYFDDKMFFFSFYSCVGAVSFHYVKTSHAFAYNNTPCRCNDFTKSIALKPRP